MNNLVIHWLQADVNGAVRVGQEDRKFFLALITRKVKVEKVKTALSP